MDADKFEILVKGGIVGQLVADAIGYRNHNKKPHQVKVKAPLRYTAKGALMISTMSCLVDNDSLDAEALLEKYSSSYVASEFWYDDSDIDGEELDLPTIRAIKTHNDGLPPDRTGLREENSDPTVLARILPVAIFYAHQTHNVIENAQKVCSVSMANIKSQVCCALLGIIFRNIYLTSVGMTVQKASQIVSDYYTNNSMTLHMDAFNHIIAAKEQAGDQIENSLWSAWNVYAENSDSYEKTMYAACDLGDHSVISVAGALAGITNGLYSIPKRWIDAIVVPDDTMLCVDEFIG